jgi:DNA-binding PadR family transcriptional regulator
MTLNDALILSYIKRGIGYGYNILAHVRENRSDEWVEFSRAGLYKTLDKLEKEGYVTKTFGQSGGRPPKKMYIITDSGDKALNSYLENGFNFDYQNKNDFDAFLVTAFAASPDASILKSMVNKRIQAVRDQLYDLTVNWPEEKNSYPFIVYALYKRRLDALEAELVWLEWLAENLTNYSGDVLHKTWGELGGTLS